MFARWYLILFIITIIFILFVGAFNLYEQDRIKRKCKNCNENQDALLILNAILMFMAVILFFGYFFSRDTCESTSTTRNTIASKSQGLKSQTQVQSKETQSKTSPNTSIPNPFGYSKTIDIISKI